jgi:hypothetical protein
MAIVPSDAPTAPRLAAVPQPVASERSARCLNCGAAVHGRYCSNCGQSTEYHLHSFWDFVREAAEAVTHADSRLWRTLGPLVFRPGFLSQQFLAGRRARYLSPFRLYLALSIVFFLIASVAGPLAHRAARTSGATQRAALAAPAALHDGQRAASGPEQDPASVVGSQGPGARPGKPAPEADRPAATTGTYLCSMQVSPVPGPEWIRAQFLSACLRSQADAGRAITQSYIRNLGRALFIFLPLLAAAMQLMYWRPRRSYVSHLVLLIHNHAFVFLLLSASLLTLHWIRSGAVTALLTPVPLCYLIYYLYRSMVRLYAENWSRTLVKFAALSLAYAVCAAGTVFLAGLYSAETF